MNRNLQDKFESLKNAPVAIDLVTDVMGQIENPKQRQRFLIPATLGLVTIVILGILLFPQMRKENPAGTTEIAKPIRIIKDYPRNLSIYPSPYVNIEPEQFMKGGTNRL